MHHEIEREVLQPFGEPRCELRLHRVRRKTAPVRPRHDADSAREHEIVDGEVLVHHVTRGIEGSPGRYRSHDPAAPKRFQGGTVGVAEARGRVEQRAVQIGDDETRRPHRRRGTGKASDSHRPASESRSAGRFIEVRFDRSPPLASWTQCSPRSPDRHQKRPATNRIKGTVEVFERTRSRTANGTPMTAHVRNRQRQSCPRDARSVADMVRGGNSIVHPRDSGSQFHLAGAEWGTARTTPTAPAPVDERRLRASLRVANGTAHGIPIRTRVTRVTRVPWSLAAEWPHGRTIFFVRDRVPATGAGLPAAGSTAAPRGPAWHSDTKCSPKWAAEHAPVTPLPDNGIALGLMAGQISSCVGFVCIMLGLRRF